MQEHVSLGYVAQGSWNVGNLFEYCNHSWGREKMKERRAKAEKSLRIGEKGVVCNANKNEQTPSKEFNKMCAKYV